MWTIKQQMEECWQVAGQKAEKVRTFGFML